MISALRGVLLSEQVEHTVVKSSIAMPSLNDDVGFNIDGVAGSSCKPDTPLDVPPATEAQVTEAALGPTIIDLTDSPTVFDDVLHECEVIDLVSPDEDDDDPGGTGLARFVGAEAVKPATPTSTGPVRLNEIPASCGKQRASQTAILDAPAPQPALVPSVKRSSVRQDGRPRFLLCAPSNVACDHLVALLLSLPSDQERAAQLEAQLVPAVPIAALVSRTPMATASRTPLMSLPERWQSPEVAPGGLLGSDGKFWRPNVVRVGAGSLTSGRQELVQVRHQYVERRF